MKETNLTTWSSPYTSKKECVAACHACPPAYPYRMCVCSTWSTSFSFRGRVLGAEAVRP